VVESVEIYIYHVFPSKVIVTRVKIVPRHINHKLFMDAHAHKKIPKQLRISYHNDWVQLNWLSKQKSQIKIVIMRRAR
jgi:hypothetical protein